MTRKLTPEDARRTCDPASLGFASTENLEAPQAIIGQDRALKALQFGLQIQNSGFNIYAAGPPGTGKMTAITAFLGRVARDKETPADWCYVNNFDDPYRPRALKLQPGQAVQFQRDMKRLIETAQTDIRRAFDSEDYSKRREATAKTFNENRERLFSQLNLLAHDNGFALQMSSMGILLVPLVNGKPLTDQEVLALSPEQKEDLSRRQENIQGHIKEAVTQMRSWDREVKEQIEKIDREVVEFILQSFVEELEGKYSGAPGVAEYLEAVGNDIIENRDLFRSPPEAAEGNPFAARALADAFKKYQVNVLVDNTNVKGAPVVTEMMPTFNNLIGRTEKEAQFGALTSDFTMIRPGSIHRANGGYLVIRMEDIAQELMAWDGLKRCLRERKIIVEEMAERLGFVTAKTILPEPIPLKVKVILIGNSFYYYMLHRFDHEFPELFKVKADFDDSMDRDEETTRLYAATLCSVCTKDNLRHLDSSAVAKIVEHSSRLAEDQLKLSTRFAEIADIIREADYWAGMRQQTLVSGQDVSRAIEQKVYRSNLILERMREMIERHLLKIDTEGEVAGQVNGLTVMDLGDLSFGRPARITASTAVGPEGVVHIDREAKLGGPIHTKGVLILGGILAERFAGRMPLSLSARLVFEQSYGEVEGDSASSAELYALLSSLAGAPVRQGLAVTGSINQKGEIQAIGGANQKIEGFYDVCRAKGLTGQQGVIIPSSNVQNLMLREDVVEAVRGGQFHIYGVEDVDEGIEVLTGIPAGKRLEGGQFEAGSINDRAQKRLEQLAKVMREFGKDEKKERKPKARKNND